MERPSGYTSAAKNNFHILRFHFLLENAIIHETNIVKHKIASRRLFHKETFRQDEPACFRRLLHGLEKCCGDSPPETGPLLKSTANAGALRLRCRDVRQAALSLRGAVSTGRATD